MTTVEGLKPPSPVWCDEVTGAAVCVNGGYVEISVPDGWSGRLTPVEALNLVADMSAAVAEATGWASRWDGVNRQYRKA